MIQKHTTVFSPHSNFQKKRMKKRLSAVKPYRRKANIDVYKRQGKAFDTYSMKQAIEEGFILDVLKNYTTFQTMFELVSKIGRRTC